MAASTRCATSSTPTRHPTSRREPSTLLIVTALCSVVQEIAIISLGLQSPLRYASLFGFRLSVAFIVVKNESSNFGCGKRELSIIEGATVTRRCRSHCVAPIGGCLTALLNEFFIPFSPFRTSSLFRFDSGKKKKT